MRERERTGIESLKVRFNNVFGYYIEISKANLHLAPPDYERKQTLVNAERFTTPELKELEAKILDAEEQDAHAGARDLPRNSRQVGTPSRGAFANRRRPGGARRDHLPSPKSPRATDTCVRSFPTTAKCVVRRPASGDREACAEREAVRFIPNDLYMNVGERVDADHHRPQHGRQIHLSAPGRAHRDSGADGLVRARRTAPRLPIVDRVFTRIGASDNLARGRSTFMVEMTETAVILNTATARSLVVLDEIGRGTATYDGLALAWAVVEHIHQRIRAKTLFATHYHELTELAEQLDGVRNLHVSVKEAGDHMIFLRRVEPGRADRSYGIEVARLAGLAAERDRACPRAFSRCMRDPSTQSPKSWRPRPVRACRSSCSSR